GRPRALATHVDDGGALAGHHLRPPQRGVHGGVAPAVRERVGRDVEDTHHVRAPPAVEQAPAAVEDEGVGGGDRHPRRGGTWLGSYYGRPDVEPAATAGTRGGRARVHWRRKRDRPSSVRVLSRPLELQERTEPPS